MPDQTLRRGEMKRQAILEAAKSAFRERGVHATSMDQLAALAQVSKRTVYNHFKSKEALVRYLMGEMWRLATQQIHVKYDSGKPLDAQLLTILGAEIEVICNPDYIDLVKVAFGYYFYNPQALREEVEKLGSQQTDLLRWLSAAMSDGRLQGNGPEFAASQLHNLIKGSCFWPQVLGLAPIPDRDQQRHLADETVAMFLARYQR